MIEVLTLVTCLLAQPAESDAPKPAGAVEALRAEYQANAAKYVFHADAERKQELKLVEKPIMRWANDDDWSGDVFVWTHAGRPAVIGCMLSGPSGEKNRIAFHEFHLLAEKPIAATDLLTHRRWQPAEGLSRHPLAAAPQPASTAAARLVQMRQLSRQFTAHMEADGVWELRLLPQPLFRYGDERAGGSEHEETAVIDGALFTWVWDKGTDPEVIVLLECRDSGSGPAWYFAPVRFSNRAVWLKYDDQEVWRVEGHKEAGNPVTQIYTTAYARTFPRVAVEENKNEK